MIEYHIEKLTMPSEWPIGTALEKKWKELQANHLDTMNRLGLDGWEYFMNIGPLFYFKRRIEEQGGYKGYTYETCQDGYVIYDKSGQAIKPYDLIKMLQ